jgi:hypothetical protein
MRRIILAALLVSSGLAAVPATAQYHRYYEEDDYGYRPRRRDYEYRDYDRRPDAYRAPQRGYSGPPPGQALGASCLTPRGPCTQTPALPRGSSCVCFVPGIGNTPGSVR